MAPGAVTPSGPLLLPTRHRGRDLVLEEAVVHAIARTETLRLLARGDRVRALALLREDLRAHPMVPPHALDLDRGVDELEGAVQVAVVVEQVARRRPVRPPAVVQRRIDVGHGL